MGGVKFFNFAIPIEEYRKLKILSSKTNEPISSILRRGIEFVLAGTKFKRAQSLH